MAPSPRPRGRMLIVAVLVVLAAVRAAIVGMADYWAERDAPRALAVASDQPEARLAEADAALAAGDAARARALAQRAFAAAPADGRALRIVAGASEVLGDAANALPLMRQAVRLSPRDVPARVWLARHALDRHDYAEGVDQLDQILRIDPTLRDDVFPLLVAVAGEADARTALAQALAATPAWRTSFLRRLAETGASEAMGEIYLRLRATANPPTPDENRDYVERLIRDGQWFRAYPAWVQSLPAAAQAHLGNVYNGSFEAPPGNFGFDWRVGYVAGAETTFERDGANGRALRVAFAGRRVAYHYVRQLLLLPPGRWRLHGRVRLDDLRNDRGLQWVIDCAGPSGPRIAETERLSGTRDWQPFGVDFDVPEEGCGAQWLTLALAARIAAEQSVLGTAWYDDIVVQPLDGSAVPTGGSGVP